MVVKSVEPVFKVIQLSANFPDDEVPVFFRHQLMHGLGDTDGARFAGPEKSRGGVNPRAQHVFSHAINVPHMQSYAMEIGVLTTVTRQLGLKFLGGLQGAVDAGEVNQQAIAGIL